MKTIYTVRATYAEPDRHDAFDAYKNMPRTAFSSLTKVCAAVKAWHEQDKVDLGDDEEQTELFPEDDKQAASLLKDATAFFKKDVSKRDGDVFRVEFESTGTIYLIGETELNPEELFG